MARGELHVREFLNIFVSLFVSGIIFNLNETLWKYFMFGNIIFAVTVHIASRRLSIWEAFNAVLAGTFWMVYSIIYDKVEAWREERWRKQFFEALEEEEREAHDC